MSKQKVTFWIEEGEVGLLKEKFNTDNQSEAIRLAILQSMATGDLEKIKTLFPYIGKKLPRIGREVVYAFEQSGCEIFVDLFCGSIAMLCYLPWDVKVVVNDINGNLTNLYNVIRDSPSDFVSEVMKLPYSEVVFKQFKEDLKSTDNMSELERAVAYFYISFRHIEAGWIIRYFTFLQLPIQIERKIIIKVFSGFCSCLSGYRMWRF